MTLRTPDDHPAQAVRPSGLRLLPPCVVLVALLLGLFAGSSGAGVAQYSGTLYFSGPASSVSGSYQLLTASGTGFMTASAVAAGPANSGGVPSGSYRYVYVSGSGGAYTASYASTQVTVTNAPVTVSFPVGAPGTVDIYRSKIPSGTTTGTYILVASGVSTAAAYVDTSTATMGAGLPQADTRVATGSTGYAAFVPGTSLNNSASNSTVAASVTIPSSCKGWTVDAPGGMSFAAGTWQFDAEVRPDASGNGAATVTVAMWKVDNSGNTISGGTVVPPTDSGAIALNGANQTVSASYATSAATTLDTNEHLCVQFWRHQTAAYSTGGATTHTIWLLGWSSNNRISLHPTPNGFASATLSSPADGSRSQTVPTLAATYSDAENDAGTLTMRLCSDSGCATELQNSGAVAATNGSTLTWTPTGGLAENTYWWQAQAKDGPGLASGWTSPRSFVIDTTAPSTSITSSPPALSNSASGSFAFSAAESVTGYQCKLDFGPFAGCASSYFYGGLSDGSHTFSVKATADLAGNPGTTTSYGWTIDTAAPNTSITSSPTALSNTGSPSFTLTATESGSSFECKLDAGAFVACPNPQSYSGLPDGTHTFQARAIDGAGNVDSTPASYSWTIDATAPETSIGPTKPAALTTATSATFDFGSTEAGSTFECSRDGAAFTGCSAPKTYSGLADGSHTFQVRSADPADNTDPSPASYTWVVDTTAPETTIGPTTPGANSPSGNATFDFASSEAGATFQCRLDAGAYGSCTSPAAYAGLGDGAHTLSVKATDAAGNTDATPASYSWQVDTVAPATAELTAPADGLLTNAAPQLRATFTDGTAGDSGTVQFQICSTAAPGGTSCAPFVSSATSGSVTSGGTATVAPGPLPDGTYHWQARAQDVSGNQSPWSPTRSFQIDSAAPLVPALGAPADDAWVRNVSLEATFGKPAFAGTGSVEFRVCSDGACLATVATGSSGAVINGATASWSPAGTLVDGLYFWQARGRDAAGNQSPWSGVRMLHLDATPPASPTSFNGQVAGDGLTLRWAPPVDTLDNFYVYVDGVSAVSLGPVTYEYKVGPFDADDTRTFGVVAVDKAGNRSPMSKILVGVPNVVGLTLTQAEQAAKARGLVIRRDTSMPKSGSSSAAVSAQNPAAGSVADRGSAVRVVLPGGAAPTTLSVSARPTRVVCAAGATVRLRVTLSGPATVRARLLRAGPSALGSSRLGQLRAGKSSVRVNLPRRLANGTYRLVLDATAGTQTAHAVVRVVTGRHGACGAR
jgi:PASTA domain